MSIRRWEIYRANLDPVTGSEQGKTRPVSACSSSSPPMNTTPSIALAKGQSQA